MDLIIMVDGKMISGMVKVHLFGAKVHGTLADGKKISCMVMDNMHIFGIRISGGWGGWVGEGEELC